MIFQYLRITRIACILALLLPAVTIINSLIYLGRLQPSSHTLIVLAFFVFGGLSTVIALNKFFPRIQDEIINGALRQKEYLEKCSDAHPAFYICISAALSLFLELALIRYHSCLFPVISFYKNFSLLSCLAGLGAGYALARSRHIPLILTPVLICIQIVLFSLLAGTSHHDMLAVLRVEPITTRLSMGLFATLNPFPLIALYLFLFVNFTLTALAFLPLGQACGLVLDRIDTLRAYSWNIAGSLLGVLCMFVLGGFWTPPVVWFTVAFLALYLLIGPTKRSLQIAATVCCTSILFLSWPHSTDTLKVTSPYQQLEMQSTGHGQFELIAAGHYHQRILNLSENSITDEVQRQAARYYELPFSIVPGAQHVAIVGAGTGNDIAAALRKGARKIDAIEIDPAILNFGKLFHPEDPYRDRRVTPIVSDARHHLRTHPDTYDLLVFGLLDSHTLLSHVNSVRLESYVYTVEAFREARNSLKKDGVLTLSFAVLDESLGKKIYLMLEEAFEGVPPVCLRTGYDQAIVFVSGKNGVVEIPPTLLNNATIEHTDSIANNHNTVDLSTDDWPFFYMPKRVYPISYLPLAFIVLIVCVGVGKLCNVEKPDNRQTIFFCLGAGFMLVETKAIAELALFYGNTWQVVGLTIAAILLMIFLANLFTQKVGKMPPGFCIVLVLASLLFAYFTKNTVFFSNGYEALLKTFIITLPMFFAGLAFSSILAGAKDFSRLMGANLIGAMVGGLLEYNAMYFGYNALNLIAAMFYGTAFLLMLPRPRWTSTSQ